MNTEIIQTEGGVCAAKGFKATGLVVGIKKLDSTKKDMAMIYSDVVCKAAGTFTSNLVKAAPVKWDKKVITESDGIRAVVVNSGIANACTGTKGLEYCGEIAKEVAKVAGVKEDEVLTASTGVIGKQLPIDKIREGIDKLYPALGDGTEDATLAAEAIMTTDTVSKQVAVKTTIGGKEVTIGGMCKGSGMIHINMCTMLGFITSDVNISKEMLQSALSETIPDTFNMVSVDGDTSTNDTVIALANGLAENECITEKNDDYYTFKLALEEVCQTLAKKIAADGEGATALFEVETVNAASKADAVTLSKSVVTSTLTKAAIFGHDANWGRILCAMGYSGVQFDPEKVDIYFESKAGKIKIVEDGTATDYSEEEATKILSEKEVTALLDVKMGDKTATAWGCDLTYDYVKINADYRS
ncbi:MAG: bifunctional ornithine acetyltransferase/N-acetylglutamate synthase [Lachnospiraceae bacterium]|nr:bifunctional ornithine acetyltransferase/N-acetylglutamate synthase [Clostridiales bacterium]MDD6293020.1 bifunctional ornithine acetyltransferase/N-acetylglutamate synthase [Eubacteriales bacterium]MDY2607831.1 bifunctional ornithine acetyltransferase/N-acetylglutamate synthase [Lachnospiraceae bacterium]